MNFSYRIDESCDELPTSLVYLDTSVNPNKLLGYVKIYEPDEENAVQFNHGKYFFLYLSYLK